MRFWITATLSLLAVPILGAQTRESLLIGPGDLVHVSVFDTPELDQHLRVSDGGELYLVMGGSVKVAGLTPSAAAQAIEQDLIREKVLLSPRVQLSVQEYATQRVSVIGEVHNPGSFSLATSRSILDVIALAGGLTDVANRAILVRRNGTGNKEPYFVSNSPDVAADTAVLVNPGDTVLVPRAGIVYALGDVKSAGGYLMTNNDSKLTVLELIAKAGGTPPTAVPSHARLIRKTAAGYSETPLPLSDMQKGKSPDLEMHADDIIYVPFSYFRNIVVNANAIVASAATAAVYTGLK